MSNKSGRHSSCIWVLLLLILAGCAGSAFRSLEELKSSADVERKYIVGANDVLLVRVWGEPKLSGEVFVRDDGKFTLQLINDVQAEGRELTEIAADIEKRLEEFVPGASVSLSVVQSAPIRYYLSGSFEKPGEYRSDSRITLLQAIATGGGFAPFADESNLTLIRQGSEGEFRYELDYNRVIQGREPNPELKNGDVIAVN